MTHLVAIILGFIEGATEFLPISSSGHLIIAREIIGINKAGGLTFDAILQFSASLSLVVYFWKDLWNILISFVKIVLKKPVLEKERTLLYSIILGTIPAMIFGLLLESYMETVFRNVNLVAVMLLIGSLLLFVSERFAKKNKDLSVKMGVIVGFFQCLALVPGISRSGATISGGFFAGLSQEETVRFSFLLSIPILLGSGLKKMFEIREILFISGLGSSVLIGSITAFVVGLVSINFLIKYLRSNNLNIFILYRIALSIAIFLIF